MIFDAASATYFGHADERFCLGLQALVAAGQPHQKKSLFVWTPSLVNNIILLPQHHSRAIILAH